MLRLRSPRSTDLAIAASEVHMVRVAPTNDSSSGLYKAYQVVGLPLICASLRYIVSRPATMPAIASGKVLVTGANGFVGSWIAQRLLDRGYSVRGTVRAHYKGAHLMKVFERYGPNFEVAVVENFIAVRLGSHSTDEATQ